jgi:hypothetical protein
MSLESYVGCYESDFEGSDVNENMKSFPPSAPEENIKMASEAFTSSMSLRNIQHSPPTTKKKRRVSYEQHKSNKLDYSAITQTIQTMQQAAYRCCSFLCYTWLTASLVLYCREQYFFNGTTQLRAQWLVERLEVMASNFGKRVMYSYYVEFPDGTKRSCCSEAWDFVHGVSPSTRKNLSGATSSGGYKEKTTSTKKIAKENRKGSDVCKNILLNRLWLCG